MVAGDDVARPDIPNPVVVRVLDKHAIFVVAQGVGARDISADEVAQHLVVIRTVLDRNAVAPVAGDNVAGAGHPDDGRRPADDVIARAPMEDAHAIAVISQGVRTGDIGANEVALHQVLTCPGFDRNALTVARDDVAGAGHRPPDRVIVRTDVHATGGIAHSGRAGNIGADKVALHQIPGPIGAGEPNAVVVTRNDVTRAGCCPPDLVVSTITCDLHTSPVVAQGLGTGDVGADKVAFDHVAAVFA